MPITDTDPAAHAVKVQILQALGGEQRILLALEMSLFARELARAGIQRDHPDWSDMQFARELLRLAFFPHPLCRPPMSTMEVLRTITSALDRAGIPYMLTGILRQRPSWRGSLNSRH